MWRFELWNPAGLMAEVERASDPIPGLRDPSHSTWRGGLQFVVAYTGRAERVKGFWKTRELFVSVLSGAPCVVSGQIVEIEIGFSPRRLMEMAGLVPRGLLGKQLDTVAKCECGGDSIGAGHSSWCPKFVS